MSASASPSLPGRRFLTGHMGKPVIPWTDDEIETVRVMRSAGKTLRVIRDALPGRTINDIGKRCKILGISIGEAPSLTQQREERGTPRRQPSYFGEKKCCNCGKLFRRTSPYLFLCETCRRHT